MTKEELQEKAKSLNIQFDGRWGETKLAAAIAEAEDKNESEETKTNETEKSEYSNSSTANAQEANGKQGAQETSQGDTQANEAGAGNTESSDGNTAQERIDYMNSRVLAIWEGQSVSLPLHERKRRITKAMIDKDFEDIVGEIKWPV